VTPTHACEAVVRPRFETALGSFAAGRAFVLRLGDRELLVTCQHLFGPASTFFRELLPSRGVAEHVCGVSLTTLREQAPLPVEVTRVLVNDLARGDEPSADVCAFILDAPAPAALVPASREPELGDPAWLVSPLRGAGPEDPALHRGRVLARHDGLLTVELEEPLALWGCSGAPIVDQDGRVLGMLVRFGGGDRVYAEALATPALLTMLEAGTPTLLAAGMASTLPESILSGLSWSLGRGRTYESPADVDRSIVGFYTEYLPHGLDRWRPDELVLPHPEVCLVFSAHQAQPPHEEQSGTVVLHAKGRGFTALELVYQMSNAVAAALEEHDWDLFDHCFFEGLDRCGTHVAAKAMPAYCIRFGS
jgi:hypothetical protein